MARRADHTRDELAALVIAAAEALAVAEGLRGVAMRRIASAIGYAPGTIYNAVGDLDEVILRVNARTLTRLRDHLAGSIDPDRDALANALAAADGYLGFVLAQPRLWGLLIEHALPADRAWPDWYAEKLAATTGLVDEVLRPAIPEPGERRRAVAVLWAALQGLASLAVSGKLAAVDADDPHRLAEMLVRRFLGAGGVSAGSATARPQVR